MLTTFMDDSTNIISFFADGDNEDDVGYSVEWSIFKPKRSGQQVHIKEWIDQLLHTTFSSSEC